ALSRIYEDNFYNKEKTLQSYMEDYTDNENIVEVFMAGSYQQSESGIIDIEISNIVESMLKYSPPPCVQRYLKPYINIRFTPEGIYYENLMSMWYHLEYITSKFNKKDKKKGYLHDYKGPSAQCWCGNNLHFPEDEYIACYLDLKLWITVKSYPIEEVARSYLSTPCDEDEWVTEKSETVSLIDDSVIENINIYVDPETYLLLDYVADDNIDIFNFSCNGDQYTLTIDKTGL
ncbi:9164_t:CDS:1, partial [Ambispora leptoticha]